jgi:hypothetical protein
VKDRWTRSKWVFILPILRHLLAFAPYIYTILKGATRPHVFSWVIWGTTTFVVFLAQLEDGGGLGAWPVGVSATITLFIAVLAWMKRADVAITRTDWLFFAAAMSSVPIWFYTSDPLWAVVILTTVDVLGFGPTVRKAYIFPHSESLSFYGLLAVRNFLVLVALENYSITTVLVPAVVAAACVSLIAMVGLRRWVVV